MASPPCPGPIPRNRGLSDSMLKGGFFYVRPDQPGKFRTAPCRRQKKQEDRIIARACGCGSIDDTEELAHFTLLHVLVVDRWLAIAHACYRRRLVEERLAIVLIARCIGEKRVEHGNPPVE